MNLKRFLAAATAVGIIATANAVPAKRGFLTVTQPDGTTLTVQKSGDENMHFLTTADNMLLARDAAGVLCYGRYDAQTGAVVATGVKAVDPGVRPASHSAFLQDINTLDADLVAQKRAAGGKRNKAVPVRGQIKAMAADGTVPPQAGMGRCTTTFPAKGNIKALVILAQFKDTKFSTDYATTAHDYFSALLTKQGFSEYGGTGCAREYFEEQSNGQFMPRFDLVGPVTLSNNVVYYGGNDSYYGEDQRPEQMIIEACRLADSQVNFADYDNDGDGVVDNVFVFYAGQGEASYGDENTIWPHAWELTSAYQNLVLDGVQIDRYACSNEWEQNRPDGVGTFIHEFSHVMGLPDLYHTASNSAYYTPCEYSVLDYGPYNNDGRTPPAYSAYERNAMGWLTPRLVDAAESVTLRDIKDSNEALLFQTDRQNEFYLFENRQQTGWDKYIPGHGMLIWHIDYTLSYFDGNKVNNTKSHQYVDIVEANNNPAGNSPSATAGWTWPGTSYKTAFTATTTPAFKTWSGKAIALPIENIEENAGLIMFDVDGGGATLEVPETTDPTDKSDKHFVATWNAVEGATDYLVSVYAKIEGNGTTTDKNNFGSGKTLTLPAGWSSDKTAIYTTTGNYGAASPSFKMAGTGESLTSPEYAGDVESVTFWIKGMSTNNSNTVLTVAGQDAATTVWKDIKVVTPESNKANTVTVNDIPAGVRRIKMTMTKDAGNIALDDIEVTLKSESHEIVEGYDRKSSNGALSMHVTGLPAGVTRFHYNVVATDGQNMSRPSANRDVTLTSGCADIEADRARIMLEGSVLTVNTGAARVTVCDVTGRVVADIAVKGGSATVQLPCSGLYIVRAGHTAAKVSVR